MSKTPDMKSKEYTKHVMETMPKSSKLLSLIKAFISGGLICCIGQIVQDIGKSCIKLQEAELSAFVAIVMVFLGAFLTGLGVYDRFAKFSGAGTIVPITGFANSIVSPAMEFKREGLILGTGAKLFAIAGPVLVYGISASVLVGLITWLTTL